MGYVKGFIHNRNLATENLVRGYNTSSIKVRQKRELYAWGRSCNIIRTSEPPSTTRFTF